ncbi:dTDP-4-dehydrorhamnose 3,5-epimerase [Desulfurella amilsii]|uniref:dTDP-4-dehydrorhamnose 3,5-epimerase n=1 Tax=Desulfurella amilsii TaxID=1562698 RepID=A0A1X4XZR5_9BACT|nr:dTDP-4-dehydrorhamnose 3,5-epimerase [Desulfurella amilsii]OSS43004.1 dTDP-4-dehydrorhamnose 3,5-epimerase [Desulfurella amilsii]
MPFEFERGEIDNVLLIKPKVFFDERGFFLETYKKSLFAEAGVKEDFNQDNFSFSKKGVLRGLHLQRKPKSQSKLVRCVKGEILDVIADVRANSNTYGEWLSFKLNDVNQHILYVPEGFLHGFVVLSDSAIVHYKASNEYCVNCEDGVVWSDKTLNIDWQTKDPIVSKKDKLLKNFIDFEAYR